MRRIEEPAFSNGSEFMNFIAKNCEKCIKYSHFSEKMNDYTKYKCSIQRDIEEQMALDSPISARTLEVCNDFTMHGKLCRFCKTERKTTKKQKQSFCPQCVFNNLGECEYDDICKFQ